MRRLPRRHGEWVFDRFEVVILLALAAEWAVFLYWSGALRPLG